MRGTGTYGRSCMSRPVGCPRSGEGSLVVSRRDSESALGVLWGKSNAGGRPNLLLQHLLDAAAVGELVWDRFLAPTTKQKIDACCEGRGRALLALLCALHDVGKATPAFQCKAASLAERVMASGLGWVGLSMAAARQWQHTMAGAFILRRVLREEGWDLDAIRWVWPLVAGHHGIVPGHVPRDEDLGPGRREAQGRDPWPEVQGWLVRRVAEELDIDLAALAPSARPRRAIQLALAGAIVMADWIASDEHHFEGIEHLEGVSVGKARERAATAWRQLHLRGGWDSTCLTPGADPLRRRFGVEPRPAQVDTIRLATDMEGPGILIVEAPTGEGKTEAALSAVEVLAARFGADGVFVGMPTQATSDPMFERLYHWAGAVDPAVPVGLLHGRRRFNPLWRELQRNVSFAGIDEFGCEDPYQDQGERRQPHEGAHIPAEWFLGSKRGLLAPVTVGTVDQLLHAATRTRHVMLRQTGLAGRIVVLDEVHAYDVYMSQFLCEALRWLADAGVPVVLLSATLFPGQRRELVRAYAQGLVGRRDPDLSCVPEPDGYPSTLAVCARGDQVAGAARSCAPWREPQVVDVVLVGESPGEGSDVVAQVLRDRLADGGCALVVRNTVGRAQQTYLALRQEWGDDLVLLHGRLIAEARSGRAARILDALGPPGRPESRRPGRLVVVATQVAEQSFDVDVDLLLTDLAPIDLILQRIGRLHRHRRPLGERPSRLRQPRAVVTGVAWDDAGLPRFPRGSEVVYGRYPLIRAAALVREAAWGPGWLVPTEVPRLVALGYGDDSLAPPEWASLVEEARVAWQEEQARRRKKAAPFLLAGEDRIGARTLAGLHERSTAELPDDDAVAAVVRDGDPTVEVVLVRQGQRGYLTLGGRRLGVGGETISDPAILEEVVGASVRLPARLTAAALELSPLPGWAGDPWLRRGRALVLDEVGTAHIGGRTVVYDDELGIVESSTRP